jgi:hypothetical protein
MSTNSSITFVCCVESGSLENQTVRMLESLRRWGGQFANAPVFAVTPRFGPPLADSTYEVFERLNVQYLRFHAKSKYSWNKFMNKPFALVAAQERSTSECVGWLDSDLVFLGEPDRLILNKDEDFVACTPDSVGATTGTGDVFEAYWQESCKSVGIEIEDLPWVITEQEKKRIRLYFNSGVFVYRRSTDFASHYLESCCQLLNSSVSSQVTKIFFTDQIVLGLTMAKMGLSWRQLPYSHNYGLGSRIYDQWYSEERLKEAKILHYHDCMWPHFWEVFIKCLDDTHPDVAKWLSSLGPMQNESPMHWRLMSKVLNNVREQKELAHLKSCKVV